MIIHDFLPDSIPSIAGIIRKDADALRHAGDVNEGVKERRGHEERNETKRKGNYGK